ncbi:TldD/PmbA family protein [Salinispirillum sp. LH 10-3-1]|uniref:TldD/PmbA family protein n=1 Tax=Salinispirillum sp. LH 10-3-1 TaxID=2952525 RepID=A0AB38YH79_9GAMM
MTMPTFASTVLDRARAAGAEADLIVDAKESLSLKARDGALEEQAVSATRILGLRVIKDQQVGIAYSEATDDDALGQLVDQALLNARFSKPEPNELIPANRQTLQTDNAQLCPDSNFSPEQRIELALYLERTLASKPQIRNVPYNGVMEVISQHQVFSTQGLSASSRQRINHLYAYALAADGELTAMAGKGQAARLGEQLSADQVIADAHSEATAMLQGKSVPSGHYDVIFDPESQAELFDVFSIMLSGKSAQDGINPWRNRLGKQVAVAGFELSDQPLMTDGFGYALFDAEGTACATTPLVVDGVLQTLLHNSVTARQLNAANTGHAQRGPKSPLSVGAHQLHIAPGQSTQSDLTGGEYLELTDLQGTHSGANAISGDFSFGASGYLCRNGERIQPVRGITVAGNFYDMLNRINAIGDTARWNWQRSMLMPSLRFADMSISG